MGGHSSVQLSFSKAGPEAGVGVGAGLLASSFTAKTEGGTSWKDMKAGIYNTRKCIEAINKSATDFCQDC